MLISIILHMFAIPLNILYCYYLFISYYSALDQALSEQGLCLCFLFIFFKFCIPPKLVLPLTFSGICLPLN